MRREGRAAIWKESEKDLIMVTYVSRMPKHWRLLMSRKEENPQAGGAGPEGHAANDLGRESILKFLEAHIEELRNFSVSRIGLFGSFARDEATSESDVDILVTFENKTFDNYMDLKFFLEDSLKHKVDLVMVSAIKPSYRPIIEKEVIYAKGL
jgi:predicted nucleotidyltransferase